jgi:hypothetical protein
MRIENFSLHGTWDENCAEQLGKEIGVTGGNEIPQGEVLETTVIISC